MDKVVFKAKFGVLALALSAASTAVALNPAREREVELRTSWGAEVTADNAWREYPRPQMVRENATWQNLNGYWDYTIVSNGVSARHTVTATEVAKGRILVPFAFEAPLSGVGRTVQPWEKMIYTRRFSLPPLLNRRVLLHFEAVDWRAQVFVNGVEAMDVPHENGDLPFTVDVTEFVKSGENLLKVVAWDPTDTFVNAAGKQDKVTRGCFYTRVSGIWQTVWLEMAPERHIRGYRVDADALTGKVRIRFEVAGGAGDVAVDVAGVGSFTAGGGRLEFALPAGYRVWSVEDPHLYDFTARIGDDCVRGYFGVRTVGKKRDAAGNWRYTLNGRFILPLGPLDQGWWPDGLLTPPSAAALSNEVAFIKSCGYNMLRKHIKVEPRIFYHLCDRMGILVLQDAVCPGGEENVLDETKSLQRYGMFRRELKGLIDHLYNSPSIIEWIPYNEGWGQPDAEYTRDTLVWTKRYDPTRIVAGPTGGIDYEGGSTYEAGDAHWTPERADPAADTVELHSYPAAGKCPQARYRINVLGEFGGLGFRVPGHVWSNAASWDYRPGGMPATMAENERDFVALMRTLPPLVRDGLSAIVYTQTSDVEIETNGLLTYDRAVSKYSPAALRQVHGEIYRAFEEAVNR